MTDYKTAEDALRKHRDRLMAYPNVESVGIGYREQGGEETEELCISVSVSRKLPDDELPRESVLPRTLDGVGVDVIETGTFQARQ